MVVNLTKEIKKVLLTDVCVMYLQKTEEYFSDRKIDDAVKYDEIEPLSKRAIESVFELIDAIYSPVDNRELHDELTKSWQNVSTNLNRCTNLHHMNNVGEYIGWLTTTIDNCVAIECG